MHFAGDARPSRPAAAVSVRCCLLFLCPMVELSVASENGITVRDVERREFVMSVSPCCHLILSIFINWSWPVRRPVQVCGVPVAAPIPILPLMIYSYRGEGKNLAPAVTLIFAQLSPKRQQRNSNNPSKTICMAHVFLLLFFCLFSIRNGRLFGVRRCNRCCLPLGSNELVMRARDAVFHLACFTCAACNQV